MGFSIKKIWVEIAGTKCWNFRVANLKKGILNRWDTIFFWKSQITMNVQLSKRNTQNELIHLNCDIPSESRIRFLLLKIQLFHRCYFFFILFLISVTYMKSMILLKYRKNFFTGLNNLE